MRAYDFLSGEDIIMEFKPKELDYSKGDDMYQKPYVILTRDSIYWMNSKLLGGFKQIKKCGLRSIEPYEDGRPYVTLKGYSSEYSVTIRFVKGFGKLSFVVPNMVTATDFIDKVNLLTTGKTQEPIVEKEMSGYEMLEMVGSTLKNGLDSFKKGLGMIKEDSFVAIKCPYCNADIKGKKNTVVKCEYCGCDVKI